HVAHQAEVACNIVDCTCHHLLWHFHRNIDLYSSDSAAQQRKTRTEICKMRPKAELVIDRQLIGDPNAKFGHRFDHIPDISTECFVPRLQGEAAIRHTRKSVVNLRFKLESTH